MGGQNLSTNPQERQAQVQAQNQKTNTPVTSTDIGAIANSGVAGDKNAQAQILTNAQQAQAQNINLAKAGDRQALSALFNSPDLATNKEAQNAIGFSVLKNAGYNPTPELVSNLLHGIVPSGKNAQGGVNYNVDLSDTLGISDSAINNLQKPIAPKTFTLNLADSLGFQDTANRQRKTISDTGSIISDLQKAESIPVLPEHTPTENDIINQIGIGAWNSRDSEFRVPPSVPIPENIKANQDRQNIIDTLLGRVIDQSKSLSTPAQTLETNKAYSPIPQAFAENQARHFDVNLTDSLGTTDRQQNPSTMNTDLVNGIGGTAQDPFGSTSEATAGFGTGFVDLSAQDILGVNKENINRLNSDITGLANTPGITSITADFGNGEKKTYSPVQALSGILNEVTAREKNLPPDVQSGFNLNLVGNFAPVTTPLTSQQREQQKQSFQKSQTDLLGNLASAKAKGITSLEITDAGGNIIGATNPQDTPKARYDILKASLQGPVSVKGEKATEQTSATPGKFIDLSNADYSQLVDIGAVPKPQTPLEYLNYYGRKAERTFANPIEYASNLITKNIAPENKALQFNISPANSDILLGGVTQAGQKKLSDIGFYNAIGIKPDVSITSETRSPSTILSQETARGVKSIINDPFGAAVEVPGEIGQVILQSKLLDVGIKGAMALGGKIGGSLESRSIQKVAESGLREGQLEFQVAKPKGSNIFEFEQGTAGKSGKVTDIIPQEFGIGAKGEKVPQLNLPPEVKIPKPEGEGQAEIPLAFLNPEKEGSVLIARNTIQDYLSPNRILVKGVEPSLAKNLGLSPVKNQEGLYIGQATDQNLPLIEGAADTGKIKPVTDFLEVYTKDFMKNPEVFGLFAREPRTLIPKNQNYPFQSFTRPNVIRYYEGYNQGFERSTGSTPLDRRVALNELYPRIRTATTGYVDLTSFNPKDFSIVGTGSKGLDRYLTDLGLSTGKRKRTIIPKSNYPSGVTKGLAERYPLMKSGGLNQETTDLIRDIAYGYKPLPRGKTAAKAETPLYPLPGLSEETKQRNRKATQTEDQFFASEIIGYPPQHRQSSSFADIVNFKKSPAESRTKTIETGKSITDQFSGLNLKNPLKEHNQNKSKSALDLILSLKPSQGLRGRGDQGNKIIQDIIQTPTQTSKTSTKSLVGFKYKYDQVQKTQQLNRFADTFDFKTVPTPPRPIITTPQFQWPQIYGLNTPEKKHGSRNRGSFFTYTVNPNQPGDIADIKYATGKVVGLKPINLKFGSKNRLDNLFGSISGYSKQRNRKSKKGLDLL